MGNTFKNKLDELIESDSKIQQAYKRILNSGENNPKDLKHIFIISGDFVIAKRDFRKEFAYFDTISLLDKSERTFLKRIVNNEDFLGDKIYQSLYSMNEEKYDLNNYDLFELEDIVEDLYSWFGPYGYAEDLIEIGVLISPIDIPSSVRSYVSEARRCYAFQSNNAVYALCRTILETAMRDIGARVGKIKQTGSDRDFYKEYPPRRLINSTSYGALRFKLHDIYSELSSLIHGYKTIDRKTAAKTLKETLELVQELYEKNEKRINKGN